MYKSKSTVVELRRVALKTWPELATAPEDYGSIAETLTRLVKSGDMENTLLALRLLKILLRRIGETLQAFVGDSERRVQEILILRQRVAKLERLAIGYKKEGDSGPVH